VIKRLDAKLAGELLTALEDLELPSLQWGVTSGMLSRDEVLEAINEFMLKHSGGFPDKDADETLEELLDKALLFKVPAQSPPRYRTRMAETLRLTTRLRQLFPPQDPTNPPTNWWAARPTLVADYRLHVAPRKYPKRSVPMAQALGELGDLPDWSQAQVDVAGAQVNGRDLARFQVDASAEIFRALGEQRTRGVIIGAGTGSGKTLAFYLPAFAALVPGLLQGKHRVHTLALYPRNELLRDQLREAVSAALEVADVLKQSGRRRIRVGALYGATPQNGRAWQVHGTGTNGQAWRKQGKDVICPYLPCPACEGDLLWIEPDRLANRDKLTCRKCGLVLDGDVALTRKTLQDRPPDILFTTTEMLNQQASSDLGRLLGWRTGNGSAMTPKLVLLDEVHTYSGVHGAQVALLLRRWRHSVSAPVTFVGLSATLRDAKSFFAQLTGVDQTAIESIEPKPDDMTAEGREYALAVRGDPVSGASLLSTSIQTAMLFGRTMDPTGREYVHGSVGFLFTDDLDVTNRFYDDLREAEGAQGKYKWGRTKRVLAGLRSPDAPQESERYRDGQSWNLMQRIGWPLDPAATGGELRIGRTSSQDAGVDRGADLIVATASLEVGFNDPRVGLILQHKAPRDAASFIQRRGRAGRLRNTRPWTVVALSDYGRDRLAYQAYDALFSPELPARRLPVGNRSVLKMQGTQALLDWLAVKLASRSIQADPRDILRAPRERQEPDPAVTGTIAGLLESTLKRRDLQDDLAKHLQRALRIPPDEVQALLWEHPRSLLLSVVPTALRRARSLWRPVTEDPGARPGDLLPEFITRALFDALNVPEVWFELPFNTDQDASLPIERALREAVPGRVSRRYGYQHQSHRTWLPLAAEEAGGVLNLESVTLRYTREGTWAPADQRSVGTGSVEVIRPHVLRLTAPPKEVSDQSQGFPVWGTQIIAPLAGLTPADIPDPSAWAGHVTAAQFATHAAGNAVEVRRMTTAANCEIKYEDGRTVPSIVRYAFEGSPAALGFRLTVDGARFDLAPLDLANEKVAEHLSSPGWRSLAFATAIREDPRLDSIANGFQRGWLTLVYQIAFALAGLDGTRTPEQVHASLGNGRWSSQLPEILRVLYRDDSEGDAPGSTRREAELTELSKNEDVRRSLDEYGRLLWAADTPQLTASLAQRSYRDTVAAAVLAAALRACPDARERDLIVDVVPESEDGGAAIWLTETSIGGLGLIEQLAIYYAVDPRRFWGLVDSALGPNDFEYVDATLTRLLKHVNAKPRGVAAQSMARLRSAKSARETDAALRALRDAWADLDGYPGQSAVSALSARLLRHGSTRSTDEMALGVVQAWNGLEQNLGFEVDARVIAFGVGSRQIMVPGAAGTMTGDQVFSLLWPRGYQARSQHLAHYQQYAPDPMLDRLMVVAAHDEKLEHIDVTQSGWQAQYVGVLASRGAVVLTAPAVQSTALSQALRAVLALPVDRDVLRVYGEVREVLRLGAEVRAVIDVQEAVQ
jgi:ATP-dependent helicase Lhr and Lhr-like helicase